MTARRLILAATLLMASGAGAQTTVESDPIKCWLKTTKTAVHIGEQFNLALTCAIVETSRIAIVPDLSQVEPSTIQLAPFEVVGGVRHPDIRSGMWRYLQFEYTLRLIADGFFGQDLAIPSVPIKYAVQMRDGATAQQGQEKTYLLPTIPVRIMSLVPQNASDIRDASRGTFADIEARAFRATVAYVSAAILFAFAAVLLVVGVARLFKRYGGRAVVSEPRLAPAAIATGCLKALRKVAAQAADKGWAAPLVAEALAALRIAATLALRKPVVQTRAAREIFPREGQLVMTKGLVRPKTFVVSASATSSSIPCLQEALEALTEARYGRSHESDDEVLSRLVAESCETVKSLRLSLLWPTRLSEAASSWRLAWSR